MKRLTPIATKIISAIVPSKYSSKFDRLSEENQRTFGSQFPRSGW